MLKFIIDAKQNLAPFQRIQFQILPNAKKNRGRNLLMKSMPTSTENVQNIRFTNIDSFEYLWACLSKYSACINSQSSQRKWASWKDCDKHHTLRNWIKWKLMNHFVRI